MLLYYADDTQLLVELSNAIVPAALAQLENSIPDVNSWTCSDSLTKCW